MVPPPNAEGILGVEVVLMVAGLTAHQIERFIDYEWITSIDNLKAYVNHDTIVALVTALAKVQHVANQVRNPQRLIEDIIALGTWLKDMHHQNQTPQLADWDMFKEEEYKQEVAI